MAQIVLGLATSHSPMLSAPAEQWTSGFGAKDALDPRLGDFEKLRRQNAARVAQELSADKIQARHAAVQTSIASLGATLSRVAPDVAVIVGDDQYELFQEDHVPAVNIHWSDSFVNPPVKLEKVPPFRRPAMWAYHPEHAEAYPCDAALGKHVIECLIDREFDVSHSRAVPPDRHIGHAFTFVARRLMKDRLVPQVPVMINTYFPPTQPTLRRCYALGRALREAIESWEENKSVAIIASGGLSHFVLDEEIDRGMLAAMEKKDAAKLCDWPESKFQLGTSEIKTWVVLAGAMEKNALRMRLVDYLPCYRSDGGTGVGAGFAEWT
jgi:catalytic LigB subunit of aromatic ring-opening dioxygenase